MARLLKNQVKTQVMKLLRAELFFFSLILVAFVQLSCEGTKSKNNRNQLVNDPPFKIVESYSQDWIAGIQQGGSGTNLFITLDEISGDIVVQDLFFNGKRVRSQISPSISNQYIGYFKNADNIDIIMDGDSIKESKNIPPEKISFRLENQEAVIEYLHNGAKYFYKLKGIEVRPPIAYPSNNSEIDRSIEN